MSLAENLEEPTRVVIPYTPRGYFRPLHASKKRWLFVVAHRRCGKTVALCNHTIRKALENTRKFPPPRYAYIGPSFAQAKDLVWGYYKYYTSTLPNVKVVEGDLQIVLPNGAMINLYGGAAAYERMRGLYFDGVVADEFALLNSSMWGSVVRPCLADYSGWGVVSGTSNGDDHFHAMKKRAEKETDQWDMFSFPIIFTGTEALSEEEVVEMRKDMTADEFAREMMCSFDAPMEGSYYGELINEISLLGQITNVPYDPAAPCWTEWDLGIDDDMFIWIKQRIGRAVHAIDCIQGTGKGLEYYATKLKEKPYHYAVHVLPPDIMARELGTGKSRYEILLALLGEIFVCPPHRVEDGITAVRSMLRMTWFDAVKCEAGLSALKNYHKNKRGQPEHNWASHGSDAARVGAVAFNHIQVFLGAGGSNLVPITGALRRRLKRVMS